MPIIDAHESDLSAASTDLVQRPQAPRTQAPRFSMWGTLTAAPRGMAAGLAEVGASAVDVLGGLSQVDISPNAMAASTPEELEKVRKKAQQTLETGFRDTEAGRSLRNVSRDYLPDPATTHGAEQAVGNLFRLGTKAVGAAVVAGPIAGAVVAGAEEGFTTSDNLAEQGVDVNTRSAVGAVTAAVTAGSFALPVAGQTWGQTIGLALAGGPASFVGQQAATRYILQQQDYGQLAEQYDPFDPVGLTLSTVLPLGFGALAMRAGRTAKGVEAPPAAPEAVDAARTSLLAENMTAARPVPAEDLAGSAAHERAYEQAMDQLSAGQRVDVSDVAPAGDRIVGELSPKLAEIARLVDEQDAARGKVMQEPPPVSDVISSTGEQQAKSLSANEKSAAAPDSGSTSSIPVEDPALHARATALEQANPDLMVQLEGMDKPVRVADLMATLRQEVAQDLQEAPLIQTAAECFLSSQ